MAVNNLVYPIIKDREKFTLGLQGSTSCLGGGSDEGMGSNNSFDCNDIRFCEACILCTEATNIEETYKWLLKKECVTKEDILKFNLDSATNKGGEK